MALKGWWKLDEGSGGTTADSSGNSNTGTITGASWLATGSRTSGPCLSFNGLTNVVNIADHSTINMSAMSSWTLGAWVYPTVFAGLQYPLVYSYGQYWCTLGLSDTEAGTDGRIEHWRNNSTVLFNNTALSLNTWQFICITRNATTTTFYLNAVSNGSGSSVTVSNTTLGSAIGNAPSVGAPAGFAGRISDVRLYDHVLSQTEINTWGGVGGTTFPVGFSATAGSAMVLAKPKTKKVALTAATAGSGVVSVNAPNTFTVELTAAAGSAVVLEKPATLKRGLAAATAGVTSLAKPTTRNITLLAQSCQGQGGGSGGSFSSAFSFDFDRVDG